ncbi:hypothetical protein CLAIMM_03122 [Cladophialophora immunda]|nr:hypothetical protein CLAIMM_03122 [Cladophialophora immunda]
MSDQSVGVYKALCREIEVKKSIIAITQDGPGELDGWTTNEEERPRSSERDLGRSLITEQLQIENQRLTEELLLLRHQATNTQEEANSTRHPRLDNDIDYESDASDLPSLADIFLRSHTRFRGDDLSYKASTSPVPPDRTSKKRCYGGDSEDGANPAAAAATGVQLGASQDEPIVLDDEQPVNIPDAAASGDKNPTFEVTDPTQRMERILQATWRSTNTHDPIRDEKEEGSNKSHEDDAFHNRTLIRRNGSNECSDSGIGSGAPASIGQIHDIFAEFEETFSMARRKQNTVVATLRDCPHCDVIAGSVPCPRLIARKVLVPLQNLHHRHLPWSRMRLLDLMLALTSKEHEAKTNSAIYPSHCSLRRWRYPQTASPLNDGDVEGKRGQRGKRGTEEVRGQAVSDIIEPVPEETDSLHWP